VLSLGGNHRVFLCRNAVDFRKAHDGLCAVIRDQFQDDPFSGDVFAFFNRAKNRIKLMVWDRNGFWLLYKRLEKGTFPFAVSGAGRLEIEPGQLAMILEGIEWKNARKSSRFTPTFAITHRHGAEARTSP
jgi:transposase